MWNKIYNAILVILAVASVVMLAYGVKLNHEIAMIDNECHSLEQKLGLEF